MDLNISPHYLFPFVSSVVCFISSSFLWIKYFVILFLSSVKLIFTDTFPNTLEFTQQILISVISLSYFSENCYLYHIQENVQALNTLTTFYSSRYVHFYVC